ncbi:MAG: hypothetical protein MPJ79_05685 [Alphaproteobacteria bacterium]|nr:hypothetical protein [Alphaproteobacteria bacterium]MDA7989258.1 hypothetical protein [Alphaproteobacteria bacterium]MDA8009651.1 hypothetical protein [Alphaproteobacteria bacterium]
MQVSSRIIAGANTPRARGLSLLEVIFALTIAAVGLSLWIGLIGQRSLEREARFYGGVLRAHAKTGANLASSDLPLVGRANQPGVNPFIIRSNPQPNSLVEITDPTNPNFGSRGFELFKGTGGGQIDAVGFVPFLLTRELLDCMFSDYDGYTASDALRGGLLGGEDSGTETIFNAPESAGDENGDAVTGFVDFFDHIGHGRPVGDRPAEGIRSGGDQIPGLNVWRFLSANCLYFTQVDPASGRDAPLAYTEDRLKIAHSTGDVSSTALTEPEANGSFRCVESGYQDADGRILPPHNENRPDELLNIVFDYGDRTGREFLGTQTLAAYRTEYRRNRSNNPRALRPTFVKFLSVDPDTCMGARMLSDAAGGLHWKTNIGLRGDGSEAQPEFFVGFENPEAVYEAAFRLAENNDTQLLTNQIVTNPSFRLHVFVVFPGHSYGGGLQGRAQANRVARNAGPAAMVIGAGDQAASTNRNEIRASSAVGFYHPSSETPVPDFYFPWVVPAGTSPGDTADLGLEVGGVALVSSRAEGSPLQDWLRSAGGGAQPAAPAMLPTTPPDVVLDTSIYHHTQNITQTGMDPIVYRSGAELRPPPGGRVDLRGRFVTSAGVTAFIELPEQTTTFSYDTRNPAKISPLRDDDGDVLTSARVLYGGHSANPATGGTGIPAAQMHAARNNVNLPREQDAADYDGGGPGLTSLIPLKAGAGQQLPVRVTNIVQARYTANTNAGYNTVASGVFNAAGTEFYRWVPHEFGFPYQHQFYGQLYKDPANDSLADNTLTREVELWPRMLDIGSKTDQVTSLTVNGDVEVTQLRVGLRSQVVVGGELVAGVECSITHDSSTDADGYTSTGGHPDTESNALIYAREPVGDTDELVRYTPRCPVIESRVYEAGAVDGTQFETEEALDLSVRGLDLRPVIGSTPSVVARRLRVTGDARGNGVALPVSAGENGSTVFRYECLDVTSSATPGRDGNSLPDDC